MFLPGEPQGRGSLVGCRLWGGTESDTTEVTQQQQCSIVDLQCCVRSGVHHRESVTHTHSPTLPQSLFPCREPQLVEDDFLCLYDTQQCARVNPNLPIYPPPWLSLLVTISLFSTSETLFLFQHQAGSFCQRGPNSLRFQEHSGTFCL